MKKTLLLIFFLACIHFAQAQDNNITMSVDYIENIDSVNIQKVITYTYPSGEEMIRKFKEMPDSLFVIQEQEQIAQLFEDRQRLADELQRLVLEIQAIDAYIAESDVKFTFIKNKIKLKKEKEKEK